MRERAEKWGRGERVAAWMLVGLAGVGLWAAAGAAECRGQGGVPVTDVANLALEVVHNGEQDDLTDDVVFKVLQIYVTLRRADDLAWQDVEGTLDAMRLVAEAGDALGYGRADLVAVFEEVFPGAPGYVDAWYEARRDVAGRLLETADNYALNLRAQYESWAASHEQIEQYRSAIESMLGQQEAYDVLLALGVFEAGEWRLMRQLMMQDLTLQAALGSEEVNDKVQRMRTLRAAFLGEAVVIEE